MSESIRDIIQEGDQLEQKRLATVQQLRDQAGDLLLRYAPRRLSWDFWGFLSLPIEVVLAPIVWVIEGENPIDRNTRRKIRRRIEDGSLVTVSSSSGNVRKAFDIEIEVEGLSRLRLRKRGELTGDISPESLKYQGSWLNKPLERSYRSVTLEELQVHFPLLESLKRAMIA